MRPCIPQHQLSKVDLWLRAIHTPLLMYILPDPRFVLL